jgi:hypothetical protein
MAELLDAHGAAAFLSIGLTSLYGLVARRRIPFVRLPSGAGERDTALRFDPAALEAWVFDHSVKPAEKVRGKATARTAVPA